MIIFQYLHSLLYKVRKFLKAKGIHIIRFYFFCLFCYNDITYR